MFGSRQAAADVVRKWQPIRAQAVENDLGTYVITSHEFNFLASIDAWIESILDCDKKLDQPCTSRSDAFDSSSSGRKRELANTILLNFGFCFANWIVDCNVAVDRYNEKSLTVLNFMLVKCRRQFLTRVFATHILLCCDMDDSFIVPAPSCILCGLYLCQLGSERSTILGFVLASLSVANRCCLTAWRSYDTVPARTRVLCMLMQCQVAFKSCDFSGRLPPEGVCLGLFEDWISATVLSGWHILCL